MSNYNSIGQTNAGLLPSIGGDSTKKTSIKAIGANAQYELRVKTRMQPISVFEA